MTCMTHSDIDGDIAVSQNNYKKQQDYEKDFDLCVGSHCDFADIV